MQTLYMLTILVEVGEDGRDEEGRVDDKSN